MSSKKLPAAVAPIAYALEQLFVDQDRDWVVDTIAPVLAWVPGTGKKTQSQPYRFTVEHTAQHPTAIKLIDLTWDATKLGRLVPGLHELAQRLRTGRTAQREHVTELAAYGLTFVAISALMPGRRVVGMQCGVAPDILLDLTPGALRGVETAGRTSGGKAALNAVRNGAPATKARPNRVGKAESLIARLDLAEVHLSLWCATPRISIMERLKP